MGQSQKRIQRNISLWKNPRSWLYHQWAENYSFLMENFNPKWRKPLSPVQYQICGRTDHVTPDCPQSKDLGF